MKALTLILLIAFTGCNDKPKSPRDRPMTKHEADSLGKVLRESDERMKRMQEEMSK